MAEAEGERVRVGCYPGSFNPPTVAHLAVAEAALAAGRLDRVDLVLSRVALGKEDLVVPSLEERVAVLLDVAASRPWLAVSVRDERLIADLAAGYDAVILGADKWRQVVDPTWYDGDPAARDAAVARLPLVLVAARADDDLADLADPAGSTEAAGPVGPAVTRLPVAAEHRPVSATAVRDGHPDAATWMLPEAEASGNW